MSYGSPATRRTVLQTIGSLGVASIATSAATSARDDGGDGDDESNATTIDWYVAVVDRIVDGEHVVLLLEDCGELVAQHVEPRSTFDEIAERDILSVVMRDDELVAWRHLEERPNCARSHRPV